MRKVTIAEFRGIVRRLAQEQLAEYVANTDDDVHKDVHADPTAKQWDVGLDEEQVQLEPVVGDAGSVSFAATDEPDFPRFECNACGYGCPGHAHGDYQVEGTCPRCGHDNTADDDPNEIPEMQQFQEAEDDHSEEHGGKRVADPRWDDHADPTGSNWDKGLD